MCAASEPAFWRLVVVIQACGLVRVMQLVQYPSCNDLGLAAAELDERNSQEADMMTKFLCDTLYLVNWSQLFMGFGVPIAVAAQTVS